MDKQDLIARLLLVGAEEVLAANAWIIRPNGWCVVVQFSLSRYRDDATPKNVVAVDYRHPRPPTQKGKVPRRGASDWHRAGAFADFGYAWEAVRALLITANKTGE